MSDKHERFFFDTISDKFEDIRSQYDVQRRLEVIFEELLPESLTGKKVLDAGCANGRFSRLAIMKNANVTSFDISHLLVLLAHQVTTVATPVTCDVLAIPFASEEFDLVISSEVVEHVACPGKAMKEMNRVLKIGGSLVLTCPNQVWEWPIQLVTKIGLRHSLGHEKFPGFTELENMCIDAGFHFDKHFGFHPWPFQFRALQSLSRHVDRHSGKKFWGRFMINQAIRAIKVF